jgi:hypothetical protein
MNEPRAVAARRMPEFRPTCRRGLELATDAQLRLEKRSLLMHARFFFVAATGLLLACGTEGASDFANETADPDTGTDGPASGDDETGGDPEGGDAGEPWDGELPPATQIAPGEAALLGTTSDGWAVVRGSEALLAYPIDAQEDPQELTASPGNVLIRGKVVFNWANVDWTIGVGDLSVWSAQGGAHEIGPTPYVESLVAASESGETLVYIANTTETTTDLMITPSDFSSPEVLISAMGLGSETTCGASIGFVGERLFVGHCAEGSREAVIDRFELNGDGVWDGTRLAEGALPSWSADETGERVFFQSTAYAGYVIEAGDTTLIDTGVGRGQIVSDGSAVLYTVGDQLRRSDFPNVNPVPVVTTGYRQPVGFSTSFDLALYSTTVSYEVGTRQDLLMVRTFGFNSEPIELVSEPVAALGRSQMTADGRYVFFLTDMDTSGTLNVVENDGTEVLTLPGVSEVVAANGSTLVFTQNASDPDTYPIVADLKVLNLAQETEPRLIEEKVLDTRSFYLDISRERVVYIRSGVERDAEADDSKGVFVREVR